MKKDKRIILTVLWLVLGTALFVGGVLELVDPYWSGMGGGLLGVGIVQTIRRIRYKKDAAYREAVDVQNADERNKFLSSKAWAWAGYFYVMINGVAVVVLKIAGYDELSIWAAYSVCLILILYWLSYLCLRRKY